MFRRYFRKAYVRKRNIFAVAGITLLMLNTLTNGIPALAASQRNDKTVSGNKISADTDFRETELETITGSEPEVDETVETVSGNQISSETRTADEQENITVLSPSRFEVAFNPLRLAVNMGDGRYSTEQVISRNYGILNKSGTDQIVTVTITVEDLNGEQITFVDNPEDINTMGEDAYAVYLTLVPAAEGEVSIKNMDDGQSGRVSGQEEAESIEAALSDVEMSAADQKAVPLRAGENRIMFRLSGDGAMTAFTFGGAMNENADWSELSRGIRITAIYTYDNVAGDEMVKNGTGAMVTYGTRADEW